MTVRIADRRKLAEKHFFILLPPYGQKLATGLLTSLEIFKSFRRAFACVVVDTHFGLQPDTLNVAKRNVVALFLLAISQTVRA